MNAEVKMIVWCGLVALLLTITSCAAQPSASPTTAALDEVHVDILNDILQSYISYEPPLCGISSSSPDTSHSFEFPGTNPDGEWYEGFLSYEDELFQAIMSYTDPTPGGDKSWSIRIGTGGNIYSHYTPDMWGESLPPQRHGTPENGKGKAPWVDEVYQSVSVNNRLNQINREYDYPQWCEGNPTLPQDDPEYGKCKKFYIHQAGGYTLDPPYTDGNPYYSPALAKHCEGNTCTFAGWGTSAHLATPFTSSIIYINRYTDCGNGILEHTQMIHNMADPLDPLSNVEGGLNVDFDFFNIPWAGVRPSNLPYALEHKSDAPSLSYEDPNEVDFLYLCRFGGNNIYGNPGHDSKPTNQPAWRGMVENLKDTGGYTTFVEYGLLVNETEPFQMPCIDNNGPTCLEDANACMVDSCTDEEVASGSHTRMQLKVRPNSSPGCIEHPPMYDNSYNKYAVLQCDFHDEGFGRNRGFVSDQKFVCTPWVILKFVNTRTGATVDVPYIRHLSWSPRDRMTYFAVNEMDASTAIEMVNNMFDNTGNSEELLIDVRTFHGMIDDVPANYNPSTLKAFTYVFGQGEDFEGTDPLRGRNQRRVGTTETLPYTRDYSVFTVRWHGFGARLGPGETFSSRIYNFVGDLGEATETAEPLLPGTFMDVIEPEQWSPRRVDVYRSGDYVALVAAEEARGDATECADRGLTPVCSGSSTPNAGNVPYFYITCGEGSTYFGKNPYHFAPDFGARYPAHGTVATPVRAYICDEEDITLRPTVKLMGFFPREEQGCASLETARYDESVFACTRVIELPTESPTEAPSSSPPTVSPTLRPSLTQSCPSTLDKVQEIDDQTTLYYEVVPSEPPDANNGILCARLEVIGEQWVAFGISNDGLMVGSEAIIGTPDTNTGVRALTGVVQKYNLNGKAPSLVVPMEDSKQTLAGQSLTQEDGMTIMTFTKLLVEPGEIPISEAGENIFLRAYGSGNLLGYHGTRRGSFMMDFSPPAPSAEPTTRARTSEPTPQPITPTPKPTPKRTPRPTPEPKPESSNPPTAKPSQRMSKPPHTNPPIKPVSMAPTEPEREDADPDESMAKSNKSSKATKSKKAKHKRVRKRHEVINGFKPSAKPTAKLLPGPTNVDPSDAPRVVVQTQASSKSSKSNKSDKSGKDSKVIIRGRVHVPVIKWAD